MTAKEILIRIRAAFDRKPVNDAKQNLEQLGKAGSDAGKTGADGMNVMSAATAAMQGNLSGTANAISSLVGRVKLLGMSMMQLSLVAAVLTSLVKLFQAISERAEQMASNLRAIQAGNVEAAVARITASYAKMREETERAQKSRDQLFDVNMQELDSLKKLELAQIGLNKQKELAAAKTDAERTAIESKYKAQEMDRAKTYDDAAAGFSRDLLGAKAGESRQAALAARGQIDDLMEQLRRRQQQTSYAQGRATGEAGRMGGFVDTITMGAVGRRQAGYQADADKGRADVARLIAAIEDLQRTVADSEEAAQIYSKQADIAGIDARASGIGYQASTTALATEDRMRAERDRAAAERERIQREIDAIESRKAALAASRADTQSRLASRAGSEQREADQYGAAAAAMRGRSGYNQANRSYQKERQDMVRAVKAAEDFAAETVRIMQQHEARIRALAEAQKRIPNS